MQRMANENRIRATIDRLLRGDMPSGGRCDIKTLASEAGVDRTAFYGNRPYAHLRVEFERRLHVLEQKGDHPGRSEGQVARLKEEITGLKERLAQSAATIDALTDFRTRALAQLAAQYEEITRLRDSAAAVSRVSRLPRRGAVIDPCS